MRYVVPEENHKSRLDKFLVKRLTDKTRSQIQKMIKDGLVLVDNKKITPHHFLKKGDEIVVKENETTTLNSRNQNTILRAPTSCRSEVISKKTMGLLRCARNIQKQPSFPKSIEPKIIFEDENFLVIDKPAGILVHARDEKLLEQEPTIVQWLIKNYPTVKKIGDNLILRPGIAHRLDKEASGVMVIAKTNQAFKHLKDQFKNREVKKEYLAWVYGKLGKNWDIISFPIGRSREEGRMAARPVSTTKVEIQPGKEAITEYEVLREFPNKSLIKVMPKTGRTHQIRVHFYALNHPLLGDSLYQSKSYKKIPTERLMLHAHKLTFKDLANEEKTFEAPPPKIFNLKPEILK